jgi:hypothetical protein
MEVGCRVQGLRVLVQTWLGHPSMSTEDERGVTGSKVECAWNPRCSFVPPTALLNKVKEEGDGFVATQLLTVASEVAGWIRLQA